MHIAAVKLRDSAATMQTCVPLYTTHFLILKKMFDMHMIFTRSAILCRLACSNASP